MFREGNKSGIGGMEDPVSRENMIKAEAEIALSGNALHPEAIGNDGGEKKAERRKDRLKSLDDFKAIAMIEIKLSANPESKREQTGFFQNSATVLAIESARRSEMKT